MALFNTPQRDASVNTLTSLTVSSKNSTKEKLKQKPQTVQQSQIIKEVKWARRRCPASATCQGLTRIIKTFHLMIYLLVYDR